MGRQLRRGSVSKEPIPDSVKHPLSMKADYADPYLYGGVAAIVGILGLIVGAAVLLLGSVVSGAILAGIGAILLAAGFLVARRGE